MDTDPPVTTRPRNHASEIILSGHVWSAVWYVAWPTAVNTLILSAYNIINAWFLGKLPDAKVPLAAITTGGVALMVQFALPLGIAAGASALVARFVGAEQYQDADEAAGQSLTLAVFVGIISALPLIFAARRIVQAAGASGIVTPVAADFTATVAVSSVFLFIYFVAQAVLRSTGDVRSPLYAGAATVAVNVLFDFLLIFGRGPIPKMGVHGAAISTGLSRVAGTLITLWFLKRSSLRGAFHHLRPRWSWYLRILNIGIPAMIQSIVFSGAQMAFLSILAASLAKSVVTAAQAAYGVALRIESVAFMPGFAYSMAATPLVGQNLGAGKPDRAQHTAWIATGQAVGIMTLIAIDFLVIPRWLATRFTHDPSVVPLIVSYLIINALSEPFLALGMVLRGALQGAGDVRVPMWISIFTLWIVRLPLTVLLASALHYGVMGAWIAMSISTFLSGVLTALWFIKGNWKTVRV